MYLRLTLGRFDPARYDEVIPLVPEIETSIRGLPGVQGVHIGINRTSGRTLSLSTFDTLDHAQFSRERLANALEPLQALGWEPDAPEIFEACT